MSKGQCTECRHPFSDHHHSKTRWVQVQDTQVKIDEELRAKWEAAKNARARKEILKESVLATLGDLNKAVDDNTEELAQLAADYANMSLSGSFAAQMEKTVNVLEDRVKTMEQEGFGKDQLDKVRESLDAMRKKIHLLGVAKMWQAVHGIEKQLEAMEQYGYNWNRVDRVRRKLFTEKTRLDMLTSTAAMMEGIDMNQLDRLRDRLDAMQEEADQFASREAKSSVVIWDVCKNMKNSLFTRSSC